MDNIFRNNKHAWVLKNVKDFCIEQSMQNIKVNNVNSDKESFLLSPSFSPPLSLSLLLSPSFSLSLSLSHLTILMN